MALNSMLLVALVLAFVFYRYILYPAFISPLSKIPTPHPIASVLPVWLWWKERTGTQAHSIFDAHQRHGPVVRVGPNEVHVASLDGLRVVFNSGKFDRSDWFLQFLNYNGTPNLLTMLDSKRHATRRRIVSQVFSKSYILGSADMQRLSQILLFDRLMPVFDGAAKTGQGVDMYEMGTAISAEFMSAYQVGTGNCLDIMRIGKEQERKVYLETSRKKVLELKGGKQAAKDLEDQALEICSKVDDLLTSKSSANKETQSKGDDETASTYPVVFAQMRSSIPEKEGTQTPQETLTLIASEFLDNLEAARVGMGLTLTYLLHELSQRPAMQSALREEMMTLESPLTYPPGQNKISSATLRKLDGLVLLDAVIKETLRAHNPILLPFRRIVPEGGASVDGYFIPAGVVVASSAYSLHMNSGPYPEPNKWDPDRWLNINDATDDQTSRKTDQGDAEKGRSDHDPRRWFWAFGSGGRMCVGNNFALLGKSRNMCYNGDTETSQWADTKILQS
jgi:cytochrome P450